MFKNGQKRNEGGLPGVRLSICPLVSLSVNSGATINHLYKRNIRKINFLTPLLTL